MTPELTRIERAAIELHLAKLKRRELYRLAGTCLGRGVSPTLDTGVRCFTAHCDGTLDWQPCEPCSRVIAEFRPVRMLVQRLQQKLERAVVAHLRRSGTRPEPNGADAERVATPREG